MPGIYRQTTETTGTYSPLKRHSQLLPSKNCATQKVLPSQNFLPPYEYSKKPRKERSPENVKYSYSLPHIKNFLNHDEPPSEYEHFYQYYAQVRKDNIKLEQKNHRQEPPLPPIDYQTRPYTPPEKRYSSNFGYPRVSKIHTKQRPRSGCIYDDVHIPTDDYCVMKVTSEKDLSHSANVLVNEFPTLKFSQMYIQDQFDE